MKVKHAKRRGEWAELCFMARAAEHGLCISKPWGETAHYDFVVETGGKLLRVQVKSTFSNRKGNTAAGCTPAGAYAADAFDRRISGAGKIVVRHSGGEIEGKEAIMISPRLETAKYRDYREAWNFLGAAEDAAGQMNDGRAASGT